MLSLSEGIDARAHSCVRICKCCLGVPHLVPVMFVAISPFHRRRRCAAASGCAAREWAAGRQLALLAAAPRALRGGGGEDGGGRGSGGGNGDGSGGRARVMETNGAFHTTVDAGKARIACATICMRDTIFSAVHIK